MRGSEMILRRLIDVPLSTQLRDYTPHTRKSDGNPKNVIAGINGVPDIIVQDFPTHVVVKVEDADGLQSPQRVIDQLEDFDADGYTTVLVVPDNEKTKTVRREIAKQADATVRVKTAAGLANLL